MSASLNVVAGTVKLNALFSAVVLGVRAMSTTGASFTLVTVKSNAVDTVAPAWSVAVNFKLTTPTSAFNGVPLKVLVVALKLNQVGSGVPSLRLALIVSTSPTSASAKVLAGNAKLNATSSAVLRFAGASETVGAWLTAAVDTVSVNSSATKS